VDVKYVLTAAAVLVLATCVAAQEMGVPDQWRVRAQDRGSDAGGAIEVRWSPHPDEHLIVAYVVLRTTAPGVPWDTVASLARGTREFVDETVSDGVEYYYQVVARVAPAPANLDSLAAPAPAALDSLAAPAPTVAPSYLWSEPVQSSAQWFNWGRLNQFVIGGIISAAIILFIAAAKSGRKLFVRRIAGLEAVDEAIGRATEMGRPILFIPGIQDMDNVQTIAGLTILARVAKTVADYETTLNVPVSRSLVMTTARESLREAYLSAGRPDAYNDDMVHYLTDEQFGYVAAVDGIMVREKPATCFYMGAFYAESLIMAETGSAIGAIQIAGTAQPAQLPFFVAACDYTLIGEELFAASAYLSGEPKQMGSLKGQDVGKGMAMVAVIVGAGLLTLSSLLPDVHFIARAAEFVGRLFQVN
jgi:hypothetical protein